VSSGGTAVEDEPTDETEAVEDGTDGGCRPSVGRLVVASVLFSLVVSLVAWKLSGDDEDPDVAIDAPAETDDGVGVTVEE